MGLLQPHGKNHTTSELPHTVRSYHLWKREDKKCTVKSLCQCGLIRVVFSSLNFTIFPHNDLHKTSDFRSFFFHHFSPALLLFVGFQGISSPGSLTQFSSKFKASRPLTRSFLLFPLGTLSKWRMCVFIFESQEIFSYSLRALPMRHMLWVHL